MKQEIVKKISIVAKEIGVASHILRYWEQEFSIIKPLKRHGNRLYNPVDIANLKKIKNLLYTQGYTIKGVQKILNNRASKNTQYINCIKNTISSLNTIYDSIPAKYKKHQ